MQKELDQSGPFMRTAEGTLDGDSLVRLKNIVLRHSYKAHRSRREELRQERIRLLRAERMQEYTKIVQIGA